MKAFARLVVLLCFAAALCVGGTGRASASASVGQDGVAMGADAAMSGHGGHERTAGHATLKADCHDAASHCCATPPGDGWQAPARAPCPARRGFAPRAAIERNLPELDLPPPRG